MFFTQQFITCIFKIRIDVDRSFEIHTLMKYFGRGNMFATVTNTTVEIIVSEHVFASVYGEDGGNLDQIRQVHDYFLQKDKLLIYVVTRGWTDHLTLPSDYLVRFESFDESGFWNANDFNMV